MRDQGPSRPALGIRESGGRKTLIETQAERAETITPDTLGRIRKFSAFASEQSERINARLKRGEPLDDIIYDTFMTEGGVQYSESDPAFKELKRKYREDILREFKRWGEAALQYQGDPEAPLAMTRSGFEKNKGRPMDTWELPDDWVYFKLHGGMRRDERIGRFQLNVRPEMSAYVFSRVLQELGVRKVPADIKTTVGDSADELGRLEKTTIYVNAAQAQETTDVLRKVYAENSIAFNNERAPFSKPVHAADGGEAKGIWFVEDPSYAEQVLGGGQVKEIKISANKVRAKILADLLKEHRERDYSAPEYVNAFARLCRKYQVDPREPAFNIKATS